MTNKKISETPTMELRWVKRIECSTDKMLVVTTEFNKILQQKFIVTTLQSINKKGGRLTKNKEVWKNVPTEKSE